MQALLSTNFIPVRLRLRLKLCLIRAVFFGLYAGLFLLALKDLAKYKAGSDSFTVQSTDITLARALNGSSVDSKVTYFCINFEWDFYVN